MKLNVLHTMNFLLQQLCPDLLIDTVVVNHEHPLTLGNRIYMSKLGTSMSQNLGNLPSSLRRPFHARPRAQVACSREPSGILYMRHCFFNLFHIYIYIHEFIFHISFACSSFEQVFLECTSLGQTCIAIIALHSQKINPTI